MIRRLTFLLLLLPHAGEAPAQDVRVCLQQDGSVVYTDALCGGEQSEKSAEQPVAQTPAARTRTPAVPPPPACSRSPEQLQWAVRAALDARDVNALAESYHWAGVSSAQAEALMIRLERLARTPVLDIQLTYEDTGAPAADALPEEDPDPPSESRPRMPAALKVVSYREDGGVGTVSTAFRLQRHFECWWIRY